MPTEIFIQKERIRLYMAHFLLPIHLPLCRLKMTLPKNLAQAAIATIIPTDAPHTFHIHAHHHRLPNRLVQTLVVARVQVAHQEVVGEARVEEDVVAEEIKMIKKRYELPNHKGRSYTTRFYRVASRIGKA